jgi:D-3-phosphoglycerate dehydrogenase / 2-oxoglutarate reductase
VNIASFMNQSNGKVGYNIIDVETAVLPEIVGEIEANSDVIRTRLIRFA